MSFDSRQYEWNDMTLLLGGRDVTGFRGIKYSTKQEKELYYAKGNEPQSIQKGNKAYEGEITLTQRELETLTAAGNGDLMSLDLDAVVSYGNPSRGDALITDVIKGLQFTEEAKEMKQGDKAMEVKLPFVCLRIIRQKP